MQDDELSYVGPRHTTRAFSGGWHLKKARNGYFKCFDCPFLKSFAMSNTELVTIALPQPVTTSSVSDCERASSRLRDVEHEPMSGRRTEQELAPVDGGGAAWRLLCAAFVFETLLWGETPDHRSNRIDGADQN